MARLTQDSVRRVIESVDIVDLISTYTSLKIKGQEATGLCPFHNEKSPSFTVSRKKQFYYCFGCHAKGNAIDYIIHTQKLLFPEAVEFLAQLYSISIDYESSTQPSPAVKIQPIQNLMHSAYKLYARQLASTPKVIEYCKKRGILGSTARTFGLGYASHNILHTLQNNDKDVLHASGLWNASLSKERFRERLMFPIMNPQGKIIGFGGRSLDKDLEPKYLNSPETPLFHKSRVLYGMYQALQHPVPFWFIVEGYMDTILCHQYGITQAVATLGTAFTIEHFKLLNRYSTKIIFCFDGDNAGQRALHRTMQLLLEHVTDTHDIRIITLPDKDDPDSFLRQHGTSALQEHITHAISWETYWENTWSHGLILDHLQDKAMYLQRAQASFERMPNSYLKQLWLKKIQQYTDVTLSLRDNSPSPTQTPLTMDNIYIDCCYWLMEKEEYRRVFHTTFEPYPASHPTLQLFIDWLHTHHTTQHNTGYWLEASRNTPLEHIIQHAIALDHAFIIPFSDCVQKIKKIALEHTIHALMTQTTRTTQENTLLKQLLELKHKS